MKKIKLLMLALFAGVILTGCESTKADSADAATPKVAETQAEKKSATETLTEDQLKKYGIRADQNDDGSVFYYYEKGTEAEAGKRYMCIEKDKEKQLKEEGFYEIYLYEILNENNIQKYPTTVFSIPAGTNVVKYGDVITFESVEKLFGEEYIPYPIGIYFVEPTKEADLDIEVYITASRYRLITKEMCEKYGIEIKKDKNEELSLVYSVETNLEKGKRYMCLDGWKGKNFKGTTVYGDSSFNVCFYEIVDENYPNAYKIGSAYIINYPVAMVAFKFKEEPQIPDEIVFKDFESLFGRSWNIEDPDIHLQGLSTKDPNLKVHVNHKFSYRILEEK